MAKTTVSLPSTINDFFEGIGTNLRHESRFHLPENFELVAKNTANHYLENTRETIPAGKKLYRARIHKVGQSNTYPKGNMGAPPAGEALSGRINPDGISYLYVADSAETAIAEVRPWVGARISVAEFEVSEDIEIVNLASKSPVSKKKPNGVSGAFTAIGIGIVSAVVISKYFSTPAHGNDRLAYLPSQYIAEKIKLGGAEGLKYVSVLDPKGTNFAFFKPALLVCKNVVEYRIESVSYSSKPVT